MKRIAWMTVVGLTLGCVITPSNMKEGTASTAKAGEESDPDNTLVCEDISVTGSHIPQRICRTARQAKAEREQAERAIRDADRINRDQFN